MMLPATAPTVGLRRTVLPNGLTVLSEHMPGVRSVAFGAWVKAASIHEPRERMGVSHLLEHMVFKGTERRSAKQIALELEVLGGALDAYTSREHTVYQAKVLDEHLQVACDVIGDLVFNPTIRSADLKLERKVILEEIGMVEDTPDDLVFELHNEQMWGGHPYGYNILGTRETVKAAPVLPGGGVSSDALARSPNLLVPKTKPVCPSRYVSRMNRKLSVLSSDESRRASEMMIRNFLSPICYSSIPAKKD